MKIEAIERNKKTAAAIEFHVVKNVKQKKKKKKMNERGQIEFSMETACRPIKIQSG